MQERLRQVLQGVERQGYHQSGETPSAAKIGFSQALAPFGLRLTQMHTAIHYDASAYMQMSANVMGKKVHHKTNVP